jgi:hypothetical protein
MPLFDLRHPDDAADLRSAVRGGRSWPFRGWRGSDDGVIGGYSTSRMEFADGDGDGDGDASSSSSSPPAAAPFLRWSGTLDTRINAQSGLARNVTRSGFAAILSPDHPFAVPLRADYRALEVCCRTDGRTYAVNLHVETYFPEDVYQGFIVGGSTAGGGGGGGNAADGNDGDCVVRRRMDGADHPTDGGGGGGGIPPRTSPGGADGGDAAASDVAVDGGERTAAGPSPGSSPPDVRRHLEERRGIIDRSAISSDDDPYAGHPPLGFQRYVLPFRDFALTSRGRLRHHQRGLDGAVSIEAVGFTLMDGVDGDFRFDLVSLRAVNVLGGEVVGSVEDERREEEFQDKLIRSSKPSSTKKEGEEEEREVREGSSSVDLPKLGT